MKNRSTMTTIPILFVLLCIATLLGAAGCTTTTSPAPPSLPGKKAEARNLPPPAEQVDPDLTAANTRFGLKLFRELAGKDKENIFISPASISFCLAMLYNGAATDTARAMQETLEWQGINLEEQNRAYLDLHSILVNPDPAVELDIANSLWAREGLSFKDDFLNRNKQYYQAVVEELDFARPEAADRINDWVKEKTRGKIEEIVKKPVHPNTIMFLINAIYFKGNWSEKFDPQMTRTVPFTTAGGAKEHLLMFKTEEYSYLENDLFQAVSLPYGKESRVSMYVFLPREGRSLPDFYAQLDETNWNEWMDSFGTMEGELGLPRFKFAYEKTVNEALQALGMEIAFEPDQADFSGMYPVTPTQNVYLSEVKHKTYIDVNEEGSEAAAVTEGECRCTGMPLTFSMTVDRPFCFVIRDNLTQTILFVGAVNNP